MSRQSTAIAGVKRSRGPNIPGARSRTSPRQLSPNIPLAARARSWIHVFDMRCTDVFITFCSIWVTFQLWIWPQEFSGDFSVFSEAVHVRGNERVWAVFCGVAALLKLTGLIARRTKCGALGDGLLTAGLFMSLVFWGILGFSSLMDTPHRITTIVVFTLAVAAAWQIVQPQNPPENVR